MGVPNNHHPKLDHFSIETYGFAIPPQPDRGTSSPIPLMMKPQLESSMRISRWCPIKVYIDELAPNELVYQL